MKLLFGNHLAYWYRRSPRRLLHSMAYYRYAAELIGKNKKVLDIGCGEGFGSWQLAKLCGYCVGVDIDNDAIEIAKKNWKKRNIAFVCGDFMAMRRRGWDSIVNFDVIEHISPQRAEKFIQKIFQLLNKNGVAVVGTPNITANKYASKVTKSGHINLYSYKRLEAAMKKQFRHVFLFAANDEIIHTGFLPMAHYLIIVGVKS